jgi:hypothetical protein
MTDYRLDTREFLVRLPTGVREFMFLSVQTGAGAHLALCSVGSREFFPRGKAAGA